MKHLGDDVSALVDGQLPPARAEEAHAHLVLCERCASLVAVERASRHHLAQAREVPHSDDLTWRLLQVPHTAPRAPAHGARALADRAWQPLTTGRGRRRALVRGTAALAGAAGVVGALVVVGTLAERTGDPAGMLAGISGRVPDQAQLRLSAETVQLDRTDGADGPSSTTEAAVTWLTTNGWSAPADLPDAATINHIGTRSSVSGVELVEVEIVRDGDLVRVLEQPGVLDAGALSRLTSSVEDGRLVHEIPGPGTTLVLQCEGVVVVVTSDDDDLARQVAAAFPATSAGSDVADHLDRGWQTLVGWTDLLVQAP